MVAEIWASVISSFVDQLVALSGKWKITPVRHCVSNFCQDFREASELTTNAQRVASTLDVYSAHTDSTCYIIQQMHSVASVRNEWCVQCCTCVRSALGVR